jgi:very-short-patch-repair endonuclease
MTPIAGMATHWWQVPPSRQVSYLANADAELLGIGLDPLPDGAPAVLQFRPAAAESFTGQIDLLLDELDRAAIALFPRWLPGADDIDRHDVASVRALAQRMAEQSHHFGPFVVDLAIRAAQGGSSPTSRLLQEVRAAGLSRVIAAAYGRDSAAILMEIPPDLGRLGEMSFVSAAELLAHKGNFSVWLAGPELCFVDRVQFVGIELPKFLRDLAATTAPLTLPEPDIDLRPVFQYPPLSGVPRADSPAELTLERALAPLSWARGREWNYKFEATHLSRDFRLDLFWAEEKVVVEVDGQDHRQPLKWVDDRDRDVYLQMYGHNVLRFPNEVVLADVQLVVRKIQHVLSRRRAGARIPEMRHHVD